MTTEMETEADTVAAEAATEAAEAATAAAAEAAAAVATAAQGKCTKQLAQTAARNVKFHSHQQKEDQFTARTASQSTRNSKTREIFLDSEKLLFLSSFLFYFSYFSYIIYRLM